ncbi:protein-L-isoaspartate O-methyltransferase [Artomyces pyxidatus]|uniref:Protein-L-isoaspartate O-methyltransferase n=1 Tax=Artomyces pyxidatus TaxID=48021 RepID=A0ACB8T748_9AGAM|nr:protein-L-isoaspartate O-methyltransferase [Artomyces pyxidatus]
MAWLSSGRTNDELVSQMVNHKLIESDEVAQALKKVDRANYVVHKKDAYQDSPQPIGHDATISAPHMHAHALSILLPSLHSGARVLDVGSGSGYFAAAVHHVVGPTGTVVGIEHIPELVEWSKSNLRHDGLSGALDSGQIIVVEGDGRKGYPEHAPYDAIHVGAAAPKIPQELCDQLASPGRMVIPVGTHHQEMILVEKNKEGHVSAKELFGVMYVPLTDRRHA